MSNLISRQAAIEEIERWLGYIDDDMMSRMQIGMKRLPPTQPEIVRCKDCGYRDEFGCCKYWAGLTMGMPTTATDDEDFCSCAKRREVTE